MLWFLAFLLNWVVVTLMYIRLDEGERTFDTQVNEIFLKITKTQKEIETILTFDLKSLLNSHQDTPIQVIKPKQFKHNNCYEIGILLQLPNKQYLVKQILQINESLINNVLNFQLTNFTYYIDIDEKLICEDFIFISNWSVQVLCFKEQINLLTIYQEKQITRMVLDTPIEQSTQRKSQIFYYSEQQLSLILTEQLGQESMLIFIQENSIQRIISLDQYIEQKSLFFYMPPELIQAQLWRQYFLIIFTQRIIVQFDLKTGNEYFYLALNPLNMILLAENKALILQNNNQYLQFSERSKTFLPANFRINAKQTPQLYTSLIINRVAYKIEDLSSILIGDQTINFDIFEVMYEINGLLIIQDTNVSLYYIQKSYFYIEMNKSIQDYNSKFSDVSLQLNNNKMIFNESFDYDYDYIQQMENMSNKKLIVNFKTIASGPYGIIDIYEDTLNILSILEFQFCFENQYDFIFNLLSEKANSYWIIQYNRTIYFILCHNQQVVQKSEIMEHYKILDELQQLQQDSQNFTIYFSDNNTKFQVDLEKQSAESYIIKIKKYEFNLINIIDQTYLPANIFNVHFKNDTFFIFRGDFVFNVYQLQDCEIIDLITFSNNFLLIIIKNQMHQISLANYILMEGKLIKLKELPTFGYLYRKVYDIQHQNSIITLLIENQQNKQFLAVYKINLTKIDCQVALMEYFENPNIKYAFHKDRYLYLDFNKRSFILRKYYEEQYQLQFHNIKQFKTIYKFKFKIKNQLIDQIITLNFTVNDYSNSLVAYQDTVTIQRETLMKLKVQNLFYSFISNVSCQNCEITPIFHIIEKYQIQDNKTDKYNDQLIQISEKYIVILIFNSQFLIFNKEFQLLNELNVNQDHDNYQTISISSINICEACFVFQKVINEANILIQVKQIIDYQFKTLFEKYFMLDIQFDKILVAGDFIIRQQKQSNLLDQKVLLDLYRFVLDNNGEVDLQQSYQLNLNNVKIQKIKIKQIQQYMLILYKINDNVQKLLVLGKEQFSIQNYTIIFKNIIERQLTLHCYQVKQNANTIGLKFYAFSITKVYLCYIELTQPTIEFDLIDNYSHFLIVQNKYFLEYINYISDSVAIITLTQYIGLSQQKTINIYQFQENQKYIHPIQSICQKSIYKFSPLINNTFVFTSYHSLGLAKIQESYQVSTKEDVVILQAHDVTGQTAIVKLIIMQDKPYKFIELLVILVFGIFLQVHMYYQQFKHSRSQKFKQIDEQ